MKPKKTAGVPDFFACFWLATIGLWPHGVSAMFTATEAEPETATQQCEQPQKMSACTIAQLKHVSEPAISPSGDRVAYTLSAPEADGNSKSEVWLAGTKSGKSEAILTGEQSYHSAAWSAGGRQLGFLSSRTPTEQDKIARFAAPSRAQNSQSKSAAPKNVHQTEQGVAELVTEQLWVMHFPARAVTRMTEFVGGVRQFKWSPDGQQIALIASNSPPGAYGKSRVIEPGNPSSTYDIWILNVASGKATHLLASGPVFGSNLAWSPDGKMLAVRRTATMELDDVFYRSRIDIVDVAEQKVIQSLSDVLSGYNHLSWSPDGRYLAFTKLFEGGIHIEPRLFELASGKVINPVDDRQGLVQGIAWLPGSDAFIAPTFFRTRFQFMEVTVADSSSRLLFEIGGGVADYSVAVNTAAIAYVNSPAEHPGDIYVYDGTRSARLTHHNPNTQNWSMADVQQVSWKSSLDGQMIYGVLVTPKGDKGTRPRKTVVQVHGGPEWFWSEGWQASSWHDWAGVLANNGYAVLLPNPRGSDGQGAHFARAVIKDWMGADYQDILDGVDMLIKKGVADPERIGIGGWSYGGYASAWSLTQPDRFKAVVVGAGMTNLTSLFADTDTPYYPTGYLGDIRQNQTLYDARSPARHLKSSIKAPVLILHTQDDLRVPLAQSKELYRRLIKLQANVEFYVYPDEGHWLNNAKNEADLLNRILKFYDANL